MHYYTENNKEIQEFLFNHTEYQWFAHGKALSNMRGKYIFLWDDTNNLSWSDETNQTKNIYISNEDLIKKFTPMNTTPLTKKIVIKIGESPELSRIVQEFLFSKGFRWRDNENAILYQGTSSYGPEYSIALNFYGNNDLTRGEVNYFMSLNRGYSSYDASTQFGEIIKLFEIPPVPKIKIKNTAGTEYEAKFTKDSVTFGCATIDNFLFTNIKQIFSKTIRNNTKPVTSINIG